MLGWCGRGVSWCYISRWSGDWLIISLFSKVTKFEENQASDSCFGSRNTLTDTLASPELQGEGLTQSSQGDIANNGRHGDVIMVFDVWLACWWELARCHSENLAMLGHPLWVSQGRDVAFLGNALIWELPDAKIGSILSSPSIVRLRAMRDRKRWEKASEFWRQLVQFGYPK